MFDHDKLNFQVEKFPLSNTAVYISESTHEGYETIPSKIGVGLRRVDNKKPLAIVTDSYETVQYLTIVDQIEESLRIAGLDLTDAEFSTNVYDDGAKMELIAKFPAHAQDIDGTGLVVPQFVFRTSHNRTWANNGMMGLFRQFCFNTLVSGNKLAYVYGRHTKNFNPVSFGAKIKAASEYIAIDGLNEMKQWYNTEISRDKAISLFTNTLAKKVDNVKRKNEGNKIVLSNLMKIFDNENRHVHGRGLYEKYGTQMKGSLWTAYQAATAWSTHVDDGKRESKHHNKRINREDKVRKMLASDAWKHLETNDMKLINA
tara:strand:- start:167 stop:1111 length:945 start_codon:yes stop_codon:yes gene_type:complete